MIAIYSVGGIEISSEKLRRLVLIQYVDLTISQIDAPNLRSIELLNNQMPLCSLNTSYLLEVNLEFELGNRKISMDGLNKVS